MPPRGFRLNPRRGRYADTGNVEAEDKTWIARANGVVGGVDDYPGQLPVDIAEHPNLMYCAPFTIRHSVHEDIRRLRVMDRADGRRIGEGCGTLSLEITGLRLRWCDFGLTCYG
jgi:hypothetical protein